MDTPILFVGQCKQGSNSLFTVLENQPSLVRGHDIRAMVAADFNDSEYFDNWNGIDTTSARYLLDKSIINPLKYNYHVGNWEHYNHKMVYMIRNTYHVLRSQFLIVLAGEASYQYCIPKHARTWNTEGEFTEADVMEVLDYNSQKVRHLENIQNLPPDVFDIKRNVHFCTFEDVRADTKREFDKLEQFLDIELDYNEYPHVNKTYYDWYADNTDKYEANVALFEKHKDFIFDHYVNRAEYERLSEIVGIDLVTLYEIK